MEEQMDNREIVYDNSYMGGGGMGGMPMPSMRDGKADLLEKINPTAIVEEIRQRLMGKEFINGEWIFIKELGDRSLTKKGAFDIANLMLSASSQNVSISKLDDKDIRNRTMNILKTAMRMCLKNWKEYGIQGTDQFFYVKEIVVSNTFITLKQPEGEGIRKLIMGTIAEQNIKSENREQKRGWSLLNRWK
jgi:hypothetical protein